MRHAVGALGLHAIDPTSGVDRLDRGGDTADQPATADRDDDRVQIRHLRHQFQPHPGGAERGVQPLERMDKEPPLFAHQPLGLGKGLLPGGFQDDLGPGGTGEGDAKGVGIVLHHHLGADGKLGRGPACGNGVVARAGRGDPAPAGVIVKLSRHRQRAAGLEGAGMLETLQFERDPRAAQHLVDHGRGERHHRCLHDIAPQRGGPRLHRLQRHPGNVHVVHSAVPFGCP